MKIVVTDPIADMLTRIRNATMVRHETVTMPASKTKIELARILREEGFIKNYEVLAEEARRTTVKVYLHYRSSNESSIIGLKRVSKPGLRIYARKSEIPRYYGGLGVAILSTSQGIMTGKQARRQGLGGEILCYVW